MTVDESEYNEALHLMCFRCLPD